MKLSNSKQFKIVAMNFFVFYSGLMIFSYFLIILIRPHSCFIRKKRNIEDENDDTISDSQNDDVIKGNLLYCTQDVMEDNFCYFFNKFKIAKNNTFHCHEKYLGILISVPLINISNSSNATVFQDFFVYLTTKTGNNGEFSFLENNQVITRSCPLVKQ